MRTTIAGMPSAQYYRQQFLKHRDKINKRNRERMAQWRIDNPDKEKERQRLWQNDMAG